MSDQVTILVVGGNLFAGINTIYAIIFSFKMIVIGINLICPVIISDCRKDFAGRGQI